ncbi:DUF998 domain-containing protein [Dyella flagellata]|uniref:DUF998 domain-containing protein n=1 Tax=Dyella flagellata TaxID=1867833 RepID=A0ABQ5XG50_9GAMM|nr:DUF998 domain-containing protein [Dyella flagellata]GLQ89601.1 hypothetical protein GCM10007898_31760 [Dyella flagellata]
MTYGIASPAVRPAAHLMIVAVFAFAVVCGAAQFWRADLDPVAVPLSIYLTGSGGAYVRMTYYLMGVALLFFALSTYRATPPPLRSGLALVLFAVPGVLLPVVAATELFKGTAHENLAGLIHGLAAQSTFLMLSFGMLLLSSRWRRDARLGISRFAGRMLAWLATIVLWLQMFLPKLPHGLMQKLAIVLILLWLGWAARQLLRATQRLRGRA